MKDRRLSISMSLSLVCAWFLASSPVHATGSTEDSEAAPRSNCPIVFQDLPARVDPGDLQLVRLVAPDEATESIRILKPSSSGLFAIRVASNTGGPLEGVYKATAVRTMDWKLRYGLGAVEWQTVAERVDKLEWEVEPGFYRLVLSYLALAQDDPLEAGEETSRHVCIYISAPFELTRSLRLFEFRGGS